MDNSQKIINKDLQYEKNPRKISGSDQEQLEGHLLKFGDLGGVVYCRNHKSYVGGNQRSKIFDGAEIAIVEEYKKARKDKTIAIGFINWNGNKYSYREVLFSQEEFREACIAANNDGGIWDTIKLSSDWTKEELELFGFDMAVLGETIKNDPDGEFRDLGDFAYVNTDKTAWKQLIVNFQTEADYILFSKITGLNITERTRSTFFPMIEKEKVEDIYELPE